MMDVDILMSEAFERLKIGQQTCLVLNGRKPAGFPRGDLACVHSDGSRVYYFESDKILAWCYSLKKQERWAEVDEEDCSER